VDVTNPGIITHNIWGNDLVGQVRRNGGLTRYYHLKDHLGSIRVTVDAAGNAVAYDDYDPWGMLMDGRSYNAGQADARYKFTGKEKDTETGMDWFEIRGYDSRIGMFRGPDPLNQYHSPYTYCGNNPVNLIDPSGMAAGEYYNSSGNKIGDDGINDQKKYVTTSTVINNNTSNGVTNWSNVQQNTSTVLVPEGAVITSMQNEVQANAKPNNEVGGEVYNTPTGEVNVNALPGAEGQLSTSGQASVSVNTSNYASIPPAATVPGATFSFSWHSHPSGTLTERPKVSPNVIRFTETIVTVYWEQTPSPLDRDNFSSNRPNMVIALGSQSNGGQQVYFYNNSGIVASLPLSTFWSFKK